MSSAIVTGASRGLGLAVATELHRRGWDVAIDARDADALGDAVERMGEGGRVAAVAGDVADPSHLSELVAGAGEHGPLDVLVNNASEIGTTPLIPLDGYDAEVFERVLAVNVVAPLRLIQLALALLRPGSTIVQVTSDASVEPYPTWGAYGTSKAALDHLSATLAVERPDLRVLWVDPGDLDTQMHRLAAPGDDPGNLIDPGDAAGALVALIESSAPSGRYAPRNLYTAAGRP